ncbi:MAG: TlpA family protein disulfide reductase [Sediminibacterium sp.]|nr:TlpA family protein disulfide reductase [Sediminibacterium sp.]
MKIAKACLVAILMVSCSVLFAQEAAPAKQQEIDLEKMEVRDASGKLMKKDEWLPLYASGKYDLTFNADYTQAKLVKLSGEAYNEKMKTAPKPGESKSFVNGTTPENFSATTIKGDKIKLHNLKGKVVVLNFWFVACPPCRMEIPELNELTKEYAGKDVVFLGVALDEKENVEEFIKQTPFDYQQIPSGRPIATQYGVKGYPTHAVLDKSGKVVFQTVGLGATTIYWLHQSIEQALGESTSR